MKFTKKILIIEIKLDKIDYIKYRNPFYLYKQIIKL